MRSGFSVLKFSSFLLIAGFSLCFCVAPGRAQSDDDRPTLKHETAPSPESPDEAVTPPVHVQRKMPEIAQGLTLPEKGHAWALDRVAGAQQFAQLKFSPTHWNNHRGENLAKSAVAPFVFKQKTTLEIAGAGAKVRLHDPSVSFYVRNIYLIDEEDSEADEYTEPRLSLVKLEPHGDQRIVSTVAFGRVTLKPERSDGVIETRMERVGTTNWFKISPAEPLAAGEYGLVLLPKMQNAYSTAILDFAVDPIVKP